MHFTRTKGNKKEFADFGIARCLSAILTGLNQLVRTQKQNQQQREPHCPAWETISLD